MTDANLEELKNRLRHVQSQRRPHSQLCKESADAIEQLQRENAELRSVWDDPAKLHVTLLRRGYDRMSALHLAGATDYDAMKRELEEARRDAERYRKAIAVEDNAELLYSAVINHSPDKAAIDAEFDAEAIGAARQQKG